MNCRVQTLRPWKCYCASQWKNAAVTISAPKSGGLSCRIYAHRLHEPCPCGYYNHSRQGLRLRALPDQALLNKISIGLENGFARPHRPARGGHPCLYERLTGNEMPSESSADIAACVARACEMQDSRFKDNRNIFTTPKCRAAWSRESVPDQPRRAAAGEEGDGEAAAFGAGDRPDTEGGGRRRIWGGGYTD